MPRWSSLDYAMQRSTTFSRGISSQGSTWQQILQQNEHRLAVIIGAEAPSGASRQGYLQFGVNDTANSWGIPLSSANSGPAALQFSMVEHGDMVRRPCWYLALVQSQLIWVVEVIGPAFDIQD